MVTLQNGAVNCVFNTLGGFSVFIDIQQHNAYTSPVNRLLLFKRMASEIITIDSFPLKHKGRGKTKGLLLEIGGNKIRVITHGSD